MRRIISLAFIAALLSVAFSLPAQVMCDKSQLCPAGGGGGIAHVESCTGYAGTSGLASFTITCGSATSSGQFIFASWQSCASGTVYTFSSETWVHASPNYPHNINGGTCYLDAWYTKVTTGGWTTLTVTCGTVSCAFVSAAMDVFTGPAGTLDQDATFSENNGSNTTWTSNSVTPTTNGQLLISPANFAGASSMTATTPFTAGAVQTNGVQANSYYVQPTAGAITATGGESPAAKYSVGLVSFK